MTTKAIQQERIQRIIKDCGGAAKFCKLLPKVPYATVVSWTRTDNTVRVPPEYTIDLIEMALEEVILRNFDAQGRCLGDNDCGICGNYEPRDSK